MNKQAQENRRNWNPEMLENQAVPVLNVRRTRTFPPREQTPHKIGYTVSANNETNKVRSHHHEDVEHSTYRANVPVPSLTLVLKNREDDLNEQISPKRERPVLYLRGWQ